MRACTQEPATKQAVHATHLSWRRGACVVHHVRQIAFTNPRGLCIHVCTYGPCDKRTCPGGGADALAACSAMPIHTPSTLDSIPPIPPTPFAVLPPVAICMTHTHTHTHTVFAVLFFFSFTLHFHVVAQSTVWFQTHTHTHTGRVLVHSACQARVCICVCSRGRMCLKKRQEGCMSVCVCVCVSLTLSFDRACWAIRPYFTKSLALTLASSPKIEVMLERTLPRVTVYTHTHTHSSPFLALCVCICRTGRSRCAHGCMHTGHCPHTHTHTPSFSALFSSCLDAYMQRTEGARRRTHARMQEETWQQGV